MKIEIKNKVTYVVEGTQKEKMVITPELIIQFDVEQIKTKEGLDKFSDDAKNTIVNFLKGFYDVQ